MLVGSAFRHSEPLEIVDKLRLLTDPVLTGKGLHLFHDGNALHRLRVILTKRTEAGIAGIRHDRGRRVVTA